MAAIVWADLMAMPNVPPSFASISGTAQALILAWANAELNVEQWGGEEAANTRLARIYAALHLASTAPIQGIVTSEGEDDLSVGYAIPPMPPGAAFWVTTGWGRSFWGLQQRSLARLPFVV